MTNEYNSYSDVEIPRTFNKAFWIKYGIISGFLAVLFGFLVLFTLIGRTSWRSGLKKEVEKVMAMHNEADYVVGDWVKIKTSITTSASVYKVTSRYLKGNDKLYAVVIRLVTVYGPVPAVFIYNSSSDRAEFVDFATVQGDTAVRIYDMSKNSQISFWCKKIPEIIKTQMVVPPKKSKR